MQVCLIASGSKGNALYLESRECRLLIDAGLPARELTRRLEVVGIDASGLDTLLLSHEHIDHSRGVGPMARRYNLAVHMNPETHGALPTLGNIPRLHEFGSGASFSCRDLWVETLPLAHDAASPVGFVVHGREGKIGLATDLGLATRLVRERLRGCRVLIVESNHDELMLRDGPYPWPLKQRIRGNHGHLSNLAAAELLRELLWDGLEVVFLAHLSETNNEPRLAREAAVQALAGQNICQPRLIVATQQQPTEVVAI